MPDAITDRDRTRPRGPRGDERLRALAGRLAAAGIESAWIDARLLLETVSGRARADLIARPQLMLAPAQEERLEALARRREQREPMAYILGEKEFWSLPFTVGPGVLVPRPETETVVEAALEAVGDRQAKLRILDLGTGSGCLLLALLFELPRATGLGVDIDEAALAIAKSNAERLGLAPRVGFRCSDWANLEDRFDLVVANPPYVRAPDWPALAPEVRKHEPASALLAGPEGLDAYRAIAPELVRLLAPGGSACLELGQGQAPAASAIMRAQGLEIAASRRDLAGIERCVVVRRPG